METETYASGGGLEAADVDEVVALLAHAYWLEGTSAAEKRHAVLASHVVVARNDAGRIVAFARAVSDGLVAWIYDVIVHPDERNRGLGTRIFGRILDHPAVRDARSIRLSTRDAMSLYERFGFRTFAVARIRSTHDSTFMLRQKGATPSMPST